MAIQMAASNRKNSFVTSQIHSVSRARKKIAAQLFENFQQSSEYWRASL